MTQDQEIAMYVEQYLDGKAYVAICNKYGVEVDSFGMGDVLNRAKSAIHCLLMNDVTPATPYGPTDREYNEWADSVGFDERMAFSDRYVAELDQMIDDAVTAYLAAK
jgi:hypothetical protein